MLFSMDKEDIVYHIVRLALDNKLEDVAILARRYARKMEDRDKALALCAMIAAKGYGSSILRKGNK